MGATCSGCGSCCDPVTLPFTQAEAAMANIEPAVKFWILHDLTPMSRREARAKEPWIFDRQTASRDSGQSAIDAAFPFTYRCRWFDDETRLCTNYDNRPLPCSDYPWMGRAPNPDASLPPSCSFNEDIGQPVILKEKPRA